MVTKLLIPHVAATVALPCGHVDAKPPIPPLGGAWTNYVDGGTLIGMEAAVCDL